MKVETLDKSLANDLVVRNHYLHRRPNNGFSFGLYDDVLIGCVVFGVPASRHLQKSVCPSNPDLVIELNRLWVDDAAPRNTESFFVAQALKKLPAFLVVSYADTAQGHTGIVYRALSFNYAGWTDMERKTPRYDYIPSNGAHTREAFRGGAPNWERKVRRKPKAKYWTSTGTRREKRHLESLCGWPKLDWNTYPVPIHHTHVPNPKELS